MQLDHVKKVLLGFSGAYKSLRLYPVEHPAIERQVQNLVNDFRPLFTQKPAVKVGVLEGTLFCDNHLFVTDEPHVTELRNLLQRSGLEGIEFSNGVGLAELRTFLGIFHQGRLAGKALQPALQKQGVRHIRVIPLPDEEDEEAEKPHAIYRRALKVVSQIFKDVRLGKIPETKEALEVVQSMAKTTLSDPHALVALSLLKDYDNYTFTHSVNVSVISLAVGRACGLPEEKLQMLGLGGLLHDLGKLIIDREIINKPGRLTAEEFETIKQHPTSGADIAKKMEGVPDEVIDIILAHHLRYDRQGYPADARGRRVSILADMAAIADTYDAMTTLRSYQQPMTPKAAIQRLRELAGTALHPKLLEHLIDFLGEYPVGSLVRLDSNEIALVTKVGIDNPENIEVKILFDSGGTRMNEPLDIQLSAEEAGRIVAEVDPFIKGINPTDYFK